jgi:hypothetical protein
VAAGFAALNWLLDAACLWLCLRATQLLITCCAVMAAASITTSPGNLGISTPLCSDSTAAA